MYPFKLTAIIAAISLVMSTGVLAATMTKADYHTAKDEISATYKADKVTCKVMAGNAKDICMEEAEGREKIAYATLEVNYAPTDKHRYEERMAKAKATFAISKEKCDDLAGNAKDVCRQEAKRVYVAAKADAKLAEKTSNANAEAREETSDANASAHETKTDAIKDANSAKRDAAYDVAKEKCDALAGDAKDSCISAAKIQFKQ